MDKTTDKTLVRQALEARERSYSPYSNYQVGAALLCQDGTIVTGCNIESASYTPTNCAERTAFFKAVSEGKRGFAAIAIAGGPKGTGKLPFAFPCGVCRQVMMEFCDPKTFRILVASSQEEYREYTLEQLLPEGFGPSDLQ